ncbi:hypothetical protein [Scleromatobacter humisilvae]|uniref:Uncharacterized protein n=1 Tax=Scleromatobacter humisilvae TaxID=2897159 RepID=A0A9X2C359_9BURK|nr:hypothetical protein [Scleromatobacter humisilvae]MCK9686885.1 hypothetical protein [Scleromatobacter humisilvae]
MTHRRFHPSLRTRLASLSVLALAACGGSDGDGPVAPLTPPAATPMQVSGTVASGAALAGSTVAVSCARGSGSTTADTSGVFTQKLEDGQLPCVVTATSADGATVLHAIAPGTSAADTTVQVTPLTELLVAQFAGTSPSTYASNFGATSAVSATSLQQSQATLLQSLAKANVDVSGVTNVVSDPLQPGSGSGYDAALQHLSTSLSDAGTTLAQLTTAVATSAGVGTSTGQSTIVTLLAVANADCPSLKSGKHRSIDFGDHSDSIVTIDARALTAVINGVTQHLTQIEPCLYAIDDPYNTQFAVSRSGMGVWRQGGNGIDPDFGMTMPEQTLDMAALAGTFNRVTWAGTAIDSGDFGSETFDANGKHVAAQQCPGGYGGCAAATDLHAHLQVDAAGGFDYYDETDAQPTVDARVFAYRDGNGHTWSIATTDQSVLVMAPQAALSLPTVGTTGVYWEVDVTPTSVSAFAADTNTALAVDAASATETRKFGSDGHTDTVTFNDPAAGLRHRVVNACQQADGSARGCNALVQLPMTGSGINASVSADPAKHVIYLSVTKPS